MVAPDYNWESFPTNQSVKKNTQQSDKTAGQSALPNEPAAETEEKLGNAPGEQPKSEFSWGSFDTSSSYYKAESEKKTDAVSDFTRIISSGIMRFGEAAGGKYADMVEFGKSSLENFPSIAGPIGAAIESFVGPEKWKQMIRGPEDETLGNLKLPTTQNLRGITEKLTGDYTKPKGSKEKAFQEFVSDVGSVASGRAPTLTRHATNKIAIPLTANAVKQTVDYLGFGEDKANAAKIATWLPLSLLGNVNGRQYASQQVGDARRALPNHLRLDLNRYLQRIDALENQFLAGDPRSEIALKQLGFMRQDILKGQTSIHEAMTRYDAINATKQTKGFFELNRGPLRDAASHNIDQVRHAVRDMILETGRAYPDALQQWTNGIQSLAVIHTSNRLTNFAKETLKGPYGKIGAAAVGSLFGLTGYHHPIVTGALSTAGAMTYKTGQVAYRVWEDPQLRTYYSKAITAAIAEDAPVFIKNMQKLDAEYKEKEKKKSFKF